MRAAPVVLAALLAFMLAAGCLSRIASTQQYTTDYASIFKTSVPIADSDLAEKCKDANCVCMVCKKGTSVFPWLTSFVGGSCYFDKECNSQKLQSLAKGTYGKDLTINWFRIGQGPSFSDFGDANSYCTGRLGMAVQWLIGSPNEPYALPSARRAVCLLDKGVLPVYILYSDGKNIDIAQSRQIATILGTGGKTVTGGRLSNGPVGPVVVTTEINYDISQAARIKEQILAIDAGCNGADARDKNPPEIHCLVAVAPKLGDKAALDAVMSDAAIARHVDLVAYGIDSDRMDLSGYCDQPSMAWENATAFSSYALYSLGKPSIIPYVLFDAAGTDASGECEWTEVRLMEGYKPFFSQYAQTLPTKGVIGVAPYSFKSTPLGVGNPLGCKDCGIGTSPERLRAWYAGCQSYTGLRRNVTSGVDQFPSAGTLLRFSDQPSGSCQDETNDIASLLEMSYGSDNDFLQPQTPELQPQGETLLRCDECVSQKAGIPFQFPTKALDASTLTTVCESVPELDSFASERSLDPMFVRAIAYGESRFDPCAAARVCRQGYNQVGPDGRPCFDSNPNTQDECYSKAYNRISDISGSCQLSDAPNAGTSHPDWRWCGLGLMQSLEPSVDYWPAQYRQDNTDGQAAAVFKDAYGRGLAADLSLAQACNPTSFNPFDKKDSACVGTAKLAEKMQDAQQRVRRFHSYNGVNALNWESTDVDKDNVFAAYIAANLYAGTWKDSWVTDFFLSWTVDAAYCNTRPLPSQCSGAGTPDSSRCYGATDFVQFVACKISLDPSYGPDRGAERMGVYYYLRNNCKNSFCPDWKRLYDADKKLGGGQPVVIPPEGDPLGPTTG